ncbi:MAG: hypothetical protein HeimC2_38080 [Candidatus Heimdallarchaeota archaeon LC_2]|nr:MAG: hypothetical protein HeimC2_38080 [Candidatus Heimdallarchaeota archaeon LC_2]
MKLGRLSVNLLVPSFFLISIVGIIPLSVAIRRYREYKINEYLYFVAFWISGLIVGVLTGIERYSDNVVYWQIREISILIFFATLYFQSLRVINFSSVSKYTQFVKFGAFFLILGIIIILFWDFIDEDNSTGIFNLPDTLFLNDIEIGLVINNKTVYSTSFIWLRLLFGSFVFTSFLYAYFSVNVPTHNQRVANAHLLWKISSVSGLLFNLSQWLLSLVKGFPDLQMFFMVIPVICIVIIVVFYPEGYLISKPQISRILDIYNLVEQTTDSIFAKMQLNETELYDYLMSARDKFQD